MKLIKFQKRLSVIALNTAQSLMPLFLGMVLSLVVVRLISPELWGTFVSIQIWVFLAAHLAGWGNVNHLLLRFSKNPSEVHKTWATNFTARIPLTCFALLLLLLPVDLPVKIFAVFWVLVRFTAQSFEAPILYQRRFSQSLITDITLYLLLFIILFINNQKTELLHLVAGMAAVDLLKAVVFSIAFKNFTRKIRFSFSKSELLASLPFFLLGFSGLLQGKIDLYLVSAMVPPADVSLYQVYMAFLFLLFGIPSFVILPFAKNLYRLGVQEFDKLQKSTMAIALPVLAAGMPVIWFILEYLYGFEVTATLLLLGGLFVMPVFAYSPLIHQLFRFGKQKMVVSINFCGFVMVFLPGLFLVNFFGITGALAAAAANQWIMLAVYHYVTQKAIQQKNNERNSLPAEVLTEPQL